MKWVAWKKRYIDGWKTHSNYICDTHEEAERLVRAFKTQLTVIDGCVLPEGEEPKETKEND